VTEESSTTAPLVRAARPEDVALLLSMFRELAAYEQLEDQLEATEERLAEALFGARPTAEALIAELGPQAAGYALFFPTFSSFLTLPGVWLEDLFVRAEHRRAGVGRALLAAVAGHVPAGGRMEWAALDWNELALGFYASLGARRMDEWVTLRLVGEALAGLAAEAPAADRGGGG
jgi:GNAT superfamily N-acetyltransferase